MVAQTLLAMLLAPSSLAVVQPLVVVPLLALEERVVVPLLAMPSLEVALELLLYWLGSRQLLEESVVAVGAVAGTTDRLRAFSFPQSRAVGVHILALYLCDLSTKRNANLHVELYLV